MLDRGLSREFTEQVFRQIRGFGEYGFPESHAASFALLVYVSAWLKHYYPATFTAALINSQPMGFYAPAQLIRDARQHGVVVRPIDVNHSGWDCSLEPVEQPTGTDLAQVTPCSPALRLGMRLIRGFAQADARQIELVRGERPFQSLRELARRTGLGRAVIVRLSQADAFASLGRSRRQALWEALAQPVNSRQNSQRMPLFAGPIDDDDPLVCLPQQASIDQVFADYNTTGLSLKAHPVSFYRLQLDHWKIIPANQLAEHTHHQRVRVAGLVLLRQRPSTAKGITFVTLEDETGTINLIVRQQVWDRYHAIARRSPAWIATGQLQNRQSIIHVVVSRLEDLASRLRELQVRSRDFR
jgi:error-prone DNA polymerase